MYFVIVHMQSLILTKALQRTFSAVLLAMVFLKNDVVWRSILLLSESICLDFRTPKYRLMSY